MCKETKRITPFNPKVLTEEQKQALQQDQYALYNFTNHAANKIGLKGWTNDHKQAWELDRMDEIND